MATITKSIGTTSRDYSTIVLWEDDLDEGGIYSSGDDAVGEGYDDTDFDETPNVSSGGGIGLTSVHLTVASAERHDGTAGTGAKVVRTGSFVAGVITLTLWETTSCTWWEVDANANFGAALIQASGGGPLGNIANNICHDNFLDFGSAVLKGIVDDLSGTTVGNILNNIVYDIINLNDNTDTIEGILTSVDDIVCSNNTVYNCTNTDGSGVCYGLVIFDDIDNKVQNNIVVGTNGTTSGTVQDYSDAAPSNATVDHNLASDTTASGTGSLDSKAAGDQFVSTTGGSEDLHLKSGADAINVGTDLGTTPSGVEIDINEFDRDGGGVTWDMGAHEFIAVGGGPKGPFGHPFHGPFGGPI